MNSYVPFKALLLLCLFLPSGAGIVLAQQPPAEEEYQKYFVHFEDNVSN